MERRSSITKRVLLKISGESLSGQGSFGIDQAACLNLAGSIKHAKGKDLQLALVIGGGNIFRGIHLEELGLERTPADQMGMLATMINGLALQQALQKLGLKAKLMSGLECPKVAEPYNWQRARGFLDAGEILIFVGGTGSPYFTTDTAAALRASEIQADMLMKATKVPGVFDKDPVKHSNAKKYSTISYSQYLAEKLKVMDATSVSLCMSSHIPIFVFDMELLGKKELLEIISQEKNGTLIRDE